MEPVFAFRKQFIFALLFVILVPLLLVGFVFNLEISRHNLQTDAYLLQGKLTAQAFSANMAGSLDAPLPLVQALKQASDKLANLKEITVYRLQEGKLMPVASTLLSGGLVELSGLDQVSAWSTGQAVAVMQDSDNGLIEASAPIFSATGEKLGLVLVRVSAADLVTASNRQTVMALIWLLLVLGITLGLFLGVFYISGYFKLYKQYIALLASHNQASSEALAEVHSRAEHLAKYAAGLNQLGVDGDPSKRQAYITAVEQEVAGLQVACAELKGTGKEAPGHE